jgi:hypothetical protein
VGARKPFQQRRRGLEQRGRDSEVEARGGGGEAGEESGDRLRDGGEVLPGEAIVMIHAVEHTQARWAPALADQRYGVVERDEGVFASVDENGGAAKGGDGGVVAEAVTQEPRC